VGLRCRCWSENSVNLIYISLGSLWKYMVVQTLVRLLLAKGLLAIRKTCFDQIQCCWFVCNKWCTGNDLDFAFGARNCVSSFFNFIIINSICS